MLTFNKSLNFNGNSQIDGVVVANFSASFDNNNLYFNKNTQNVSKYSENKEQVQADYAEFEEKVMSIVGSSNVSETIVEETEEVE